MFCSDISIQDSCIRSSSLIDTDMLMLNDVFIWQCDPYFDTDGCGHPGCEPGYPTPKCVRKCVDGNILWKKSKHYAQNAYRISSDPYHIMAEVYQNGPVEVSFTVYEVKESSCSVSFCYQLDATN